MSKRRNRRSDEKRPLGLQDEEAIIAENVEGEINPEESAEQTAEGEPPQTAEPETDTLKPDEESHTSVPAEADEAPLPVPDSEEAPAAEEPLAESDAAEEPESDKPLPRLGKHGRPLKKDPYGNPIKKKKKGAPLRKAEPEQSTQPGDIPKPQVSFMNSIANIEPSSQMHNAGPTTSEAYDHAVISENEEDEEVREYTPKIRRMSDSTRAKEVRGRKKSGESGPYERDTLLDSPAQPAKSKRKRKKRSLEDLFPPLMPESAFDEEEARPEQEAPEAAEPESETNESESAHAEPIEQIAEPEEVQAPERDYRIPQERTAIRRELQELRASLSRRSAIVGLLTLFSAAMTFLDWLPGFRTLELLSSTESPVSYIGIQIILALLTLPFCFRILIDGYLKLTQLRADCDSLTSLAMFSSLISAILVLPSPGMLKGGIVSIYVSVGMLSVWLNLISKQFIAARAVRNFDVLSDGNPKYMIHYVEDERRAESFTRGTTGDFPILATMQQVDRAEDFLKYSFSTDVGDKFCRTAVPIFFALSAIFSVWMSIAHYSEVESVFAYGMAIFALCFSACACAAITLISNLPMENATKEYVRNSGILLGYQSVDDFYDINTVMVDATTLFPKRATKLETIQVVGESRIEEALQYAASLTQHAGSILRELFASAIEAEDRMILPVENYAYDEGKGISGWIQNKRVLLGTREMMIDHNVEGLPPVHKEDELVAGGNQVLYLAVSGSLAALFVIKLEASRKVRHWLEMLLRENIFLLIRSNDALLTQRGIAKMFAIPEDSIKVLPARLEPDYLAETAPLESAKPSMLCAGRLAGFVQTLVGAKKIRAAATVGLILQIVTAVLGLLYVLIFVLLNAYEDVNGGILLIYQAICSLVTAFAVRLKEN